MPRIAFGSYALDMEARLLSAAGGAVHLEPKVMDLLLYLVQNAERCVSKEELRAALWPDAVVGEGSLPRLVKELRKALGQEGEQTSLLRTVHGRGYQFLGEIVATHAREPDADAAALCIGPGLSRVIATLPRVAAQGLPIILEGETGTGKGCVARSIHAWSGRTGVLLSLQCVGVSESELESALQRARQGPHTLLLDELGELAAPLQRRLLAALCQECPASPGCLSRRVVVTSQYSLHALVERGQLRADLLGRCGGITLELPPLRERREDVPALLRFFLRRAGSDAAERVPPAVLERLAAYDWPFNVRELEMHVLRWVALASTDVELLLPPKPRAGSATQPSPGGWSRRASARRARRP